MNKFAITSLKPKSKNVLIGASTALVALATLAVNSFAQTPYVIATGDTGAIGAMSSGATSSFLGLFEANWPVIVTFAITIAGFFFIFGVIMGMLRRKHG